MAASLVRSVRSDGLQAFFRAVRLAVLALRRGFGIAFCSSAHLSRNVDEFEFFEIYLKKGILRTLKKKCTQISSRCGQFALITRSAFDDRAEHKPPKRTAAQLTAGSCAAGGAASCAASGAAWPATGSAAGSLFKIMLQNRTNKKNEHNPQRDGFFF